MNNHSFIIDRPTGVCDPIARFKQDDCLNLTLDAFEMAVDITMNRLGSARKEASTA